MFKPLPVGTVGRITVTTQHYSRVLHVDAVLHAVIANVLGPDDWTYLYLRHINNVEVVRVDAVLSDVLYITRAQDGTQRMLLPPDTTAHYDTTIAGIEDTVREQVEAITLTGTGVVHVSGNHVRVDPVVISSDDALEITDSNQIWDGNYDPCEPYKCAGYELGPFYYTSRPYPVEATERMTTDGGFVWVRLNVQPFIYEHFKFSGILLGGTIAGGGKVYAMRPEHFIFDGMLLNGTIVGGGKTYTMLPDHFIFGGMVLNGEISGGGVAYVMLPEHFMFDGSLIEGIME